MPRSSQWRAWSCRPWKAWRRPSRRSSRIPIRLAGRASDASWIRWASCSRQRAWLARLCRLATTANENWSISLRMIREQSWSSYRASNAEEALGFASNDVRWSEENVLAHRLEQSVSTVAVIATQAVQDNVDSFWRDPKNHNFVRKVEKNTKFIEKLTFWLRWRNQCGQSSDRRVLQWWAPRACPWSTRRTEWCPRKCGPAVQWLDPAKKKKLQMRKLISRFTSLN